jgi:hypothetical protein
MNDLRTEKDVKAVMTKVNILFCHPGRAEEKPVTVLTFWA